jgi:hypothetical protein
VQIPQDSQEKAADWHVVLQILDLKRSLVSSVQHIALPSEAEFVIDDQTNMLVRPIWIPPGLEPVGIYG